MKKILFLFAMLASVAASAQRTTPVTIENTKVDYSTKIVTFDLSWKGSDATHRDKVWVFVDVQPVTGTNTLGSWSPATLVPSATTVTAGSGNQYSSLTHTVVSGNTRGVWVKGTATNTTSTFAATVKVTLANGTPAKFNVCAYATDYPPNVTLDNGTYTFNGTTDFIVNNPAQTITTKTVEKANLIVNSSTTFTDASSCPGIGSLYCPYTGSDLYMDATHLCRPRASGAGNWEAYIKDIRDDQIYRIVQMPTDTWWMAQDLMWDGKPNPVATSYTIRGVARDCGTHYGCGRMYNSSATGAGAYSSSANTRRNSDVCPSGWLIPSTDELCPYATYNGTNSPYLGTDEFGGDDTWGLSLWLCSDAWFYCGVRITAYVGSAATPFRYYRTHPTYSGTSCVENGDYGGARNVRCVRTL